MPTSPASSQPSTERTVFVISPIGSPGTPEHRRAALVLEYIIRRAFIEGWKVIRADLESSPDSITTQVIGRIVDSDMIVADLTDHNPNVFYELAVAHGYSKPVIHLMQEGQKVPFDVVDQRVIFYDLTDPESVDKAIRGLRASAKWLDEHGGESRNPLSSFGQFRAIRDTDAPGVDGDALVSALSSLSRQVSKLERRVREQEWARSEVRLPSDLPLEGAAFDTHTRQHELSEIEARMNHLLIRDEQSEESEIELQKLQRRRSYLLQQLRHLP